MIAGILLAGGRGERANSKVPKQFIKLEDKYLFEYPLESFERSNIFEHIVLVVPEDWGETLSIFWKNSNQISSSYTTYPDLF